MKNKVNLFLKLGLIASTLALGSAGSSTIWEKSDIEKGIEEKLAAYKHVKYDNSGSINGYPMGKYSSESPYPMPQLFIEANKKNIYYQISEHFRLFEFVQRKPIEADFKYLFIDPRVITKLEMVIDELEEKGYNPGGILIASAFRSPWYNAEETDGETYSTHTYGMAIDFLVGDVDMDGDEDLQDARIVYTIIDGIDQSDPRLLGGAGVYAPPTEEDVPFVRTDVRGYYKRWNTETKRVPLDSQSSDRSDSEETATGPQEKC